MTLRETIKRLENNEHSPWVIQELLVEFLVDRGLAAEASLWLLKNSSLADQTLTEPLDNG